MPNIAYGNMDVLQDNEEEIIQSRLLTCDLHLCIQVCLLSGDEGAGGAPVGSRVSGCEVAYQQDQRVGELPWCQLQTAQGRAAGRAVTSVIDSVPWQLCVQVLIGYTGEMEVSTLPRFLPLAHTEASWDIWGKQRRDGQMINGEEEREHEWNKNLLFDEWAISVSPTWECGSCQVPETRRADSTDPPFL